MKEEERCNMRVSIETKKIVMEAKEKFPSFKSADDVVFVAVSKLMKGAK